MAIERACVRELQKPWGVADPRPWSGIQSPGSSLGELCFERPGAAATTLLLKILLTSQPLSIQVHPDDTFAQSIGLPRGKTEAWYVLSAEPGAAVALGLKHPVTPQQLRLAVADGLVADLVAWRTISAGETVEVPAGTIHAIGPGLVIAEIQQRSDATFRLFDHGRSREIHIDHALTAAHMVPAAPQVLPRNLANGRTQLAANLHFVFERLELEANSIWQLDASRETWLLVLSGAATADDFDLQQGQALFAEDARVPLLIGEKGVVCLVAYTGRGGPNPHLLSPVEAPSARDMRLSHDGTGMQFGGGL